MVIHGYDIIYLHDAAKNLGEMIDYSVNDKGLEGEQILDMFIVSGYADQFENGNPRVIAGMNGVELAIEVIETVKGSSQYIKPSNRYYRTPEYWVGWILAQYQWYKAKKFIQILQGISYDDILRMYPTLHEADVTKFYSIADDMLKTRLPDTNLKRLREEAGLSQSKLANMSKVTLRSIQVYEQKNRDINKAQVSTIAKIAGVLRCDIAELMEVNNRYEIFS